jgi:hypothetical protein
MPGYGSGMVVCLWLSPVVGNMPLSGRYSTYPSCSVFPRHLSPQNSDIRQKSKFIILFAY